MGRLRWSTLAGTAALVAFTGYASWEQDTAKAISDRTLALVRGADEEYQSLGTHSCDQQGAQAAGGGAVPASSCDYNNSSPPINARCGKCDASSTWANYGIDPYTVSMGTGRQPEYVNCGFAQRGTCTIVYGPPSTFKCLSLSYIINQFGNPTLCSFLEYVQPQPTTSENGGN